MIFKIKLILAIFIGFFCREDSTTVAEKLPIANEIITTNVNTFKIPLWKAPVKTFQMPTLAELKQCESTREDCIKNCNTNNNDCLLVCPVCPIIISSHAVLVEGINDTNSEVLDNDPISHNQTAIVKLTNVMHNFVDISSDNVNATNSIDVQISQNDSSLVGGKFGLGYNKSGPCCVAVQPKMCQLSWSAPKCHHKRHKTCGNHCTSRIIHTRKRLRCKSKNGCPTIKYITQSQIPKCMYLPYWPFVTCGDNYRQQCDGCYDHYEDKNFNERKIPFRCRACYTENFDYGQYYRRGPVFRPIYYHQPPCFIIGTCGIYGNMMYDRFGIPLGKIIFVPQMYNGFSLNYPITFNSKEKIVSEKETSNADEQFKEINFDPDGWELDKQKCKKENENGTISIVDCVINLSLLNKMPVDNINHLQYNYIDANKNILHRRRRMNPMSNPFVRRKYIGRHRKRHNKKSITEGSLI